MADPQGLITFPGLDRPIEATFSFASGVSPNICQVTIAPQKKLESKRGTLTLRFGGTKMTWDDCLLDGRTAERTGRGEFWRVNIVDRRWMWSLGEISGHYNVTNKFGELIDDSEKTPHELAKLCFDAMQEQNPDLGALPNDGRPEVEWRVANPARALADLLDRYGCTLVLQQNNRVRIVQRGVGAQLPQNLPLTQLSGGVDQQERPSSIRVVANETLHEVEALLEPVGLDTDDQIKLIDDLSYRPADGWEGDNPVDMVQASTDGEAPDKILQLARSTVFRWYRIAFTAGEIPGYGAIRRLDQVLPVEPFMAETEKVFGLERRKRARIWGVWHDAELGNVENVAKKLTPYHEAKVFVDEDRWSLDNRTAIVRFSDRMVQMDASLKPKAATLAIRIAVRVKDERTRAPERLTEERRVGPAGTPPLIVQRPELVRIWRAKYRDTERQLFDQPTNNDREIRPKATKILDDTLAAINRQTHPLTATYAGLHKIDLDGAVSQVTWRLSTTGPSTTTASRNDEQVDVMPPAAVRRQSERLRGAEA